MKRILAVITALLLFVPMMAAFAQDEADEETEMPVTEAVEETAESTELLAQDVIYVVVPRDNIDRIGAYFDVRVSCIREKNNLRPGQIIYPGDTLLISASCPVYDGADIVINPRSNPPGLDGSDGTYYVRRNDTLDTIGQALNISVDSLRQENSIVWGRDLLAGQLLVIPRGAPEYGVTPPLVTSRAVESAPAGATIHVVQPRETVDGISALYNRDHRCVLAANEITNTRLVLPGTSLLIPEDCGPYTGAAYVPPQG